MIRRCGWCRKFQGIKRPLLDLRETTGICKLCKARLEVEEMLRPLQKYLDRIPAQLSE